jgi:hypothetical protein
VLSAALIGCLRARVAAAAIIIAAVPTTGFTYCQCLLIFIHQIPIGSVVVACHCWMSHRGFAVTGWWSMRQNNVETPLGALEMRILCF